MEQTDTQRGSVGRSALKLVFYGFLRLLISLLFAKGYPSAHVDGTGADDERRQRRLILNGWLIICGMSVAFALYGVFAFFVIGDKGPPGWDFGGVQDIPGGSEYSTYPFRGAATEAEPQHVSQKPSDAAPDLIGPPPTAGKLFEGEEHEGPGKGAMRGEYGPGT